MVLITLVTNGTHFLLEDQGAKFEDNRLFTSFVPSVMTDQVIIHCMMCITFNSNVSFLQGNVKTNKYEA